MLRQNGPDRDPNIPGYNQIRGRLTSDYTQSGGCYRLANSWAEQCRRGWASWKSHLDCHPSLTTTLEPLAEQGMESQRPQIRRLMPTRTIDIGPPNEPYQPRLIVHIGEEVTVQDAAYRPWITLSHCWGGSSPLSTTVSNLVAMKAGFAFSSLPKTFQDAVVMTRKLGLRNLWIDSLCIIQDSRMDWVLEASRMADVYAYSYLTIAAHAAKNCHQGIFHPRSSIFIPMPLRLRSESLGWDTTVYIQPLLENWEAAVTGSNSYLGSRGWALQESLLSPRTLHVCKGQIFWECRDGVKAEGNMAPVPSIRSLWKHWSWENNKRFTLPVPPLPEWKDGAWLEKQEKKLVETENEWLVVEKPEVDKEVMYLRWYIMLENYNERSLTFQSDIFSALSGLAAAFNTVLDEYYLAGLFSNDLSQGLLWHVPEYIKERAKKPDCYLAPSWSWASVIGRKEWAKPRESARQGTYQVEVIMCKIGFGEAKGNEHKDGRSYISYSPSSKDNIERYFHSGHINSGELVLRGRFRTLKSWKYIDSRSVNWQLSDLPMDHPLDYLAVHRKPLNTRFWFDTCSQKAFASELDQNGDCGLLQIGTWGPSTLVLYALILKPVAGEGDIKTYKRIGLTAIFVRRDENRNFNDRGVNILWPVVTLRIV